MKREPICYKMNILKESAVKLQSLSKTVYGTFIQSRRINFS